MKKVWNKLYITALLLIIILAGCSTESGKGTPYGGKNVEVSDRSTTNQVVAAVSSEPDEGFDPTAGWGHGTTPLIQSTLVRYNQDRSLENDLAEYYRVSDDGLLWEFRLRTDAFFTDGTQVKASDVAFTFMTAKESASALDLAFLEECRETGENTVGFFLSTPMSTFINTIASVGIVPQHLYDGNYGNEPIGSGPWKFVQWNKGEQVILEANKEYYGTVPEIDKAVIVFMDTDAAYAAAQAGKVDVALTAANYGSNEVDGMHLEAVSTTDNLGFTMPMYPDTGEVSEDGYKIGNNVTSNIEIRKALAYGLDRQRLADDAVDGFAAPAYSENDGMPWNNPETAIETDAEKAKEILKQGGWHDSDSDGILDKEGVKAEFICIYPSGDSVRQSTAMAAAQQAAELGINITVEGTSWDDISKRMFSDAVVMGWGSENPYTSYMLFHSSNGLKSDYYNPEGYSSETADRYLESALHALTPEDAFQYWKLAQWDGSTGTSMKGDCPWVWLVNIQHLYFVRDGLNIGDQQLHAHGESWTLLQNLQDWKWE